MPVLPRRRQLLANTLKPLLLFLQRFALRLRNVRVRQQRPIVHHEARIDDRFRRRHEFNRSRPHARVVALQKGNFAHVRRLDKIKVTHVVQFTVSPRLIQSHPLKFQIRRPDRALPTPLFALVRQLNVAHHLRDGQLKANLLSRHDIGRARDQDALSIRHQRKGLSRLHSGRDRHFKDLRFRRRFRFIPHHRRHNPHAHVGSGRLRARHHEPLSRHVDGKLHAGINIGRNRDEIRLRGTARFAGVLVDALHVGRHGDGAAVARSFGDRNGRHAELRVIGDGFGRQRDLQRLSRTGRRRALDADAAGARVDGEFGTGLDALGDGDAVDLGGAVAGAGDLVGSGARRCGESGGAVVVGLLLLLLLWGCRRHGAALLLLLFLLGLTRWIDVRTAEDRIVVVIDIRLLLLLLLLLLILLMIETGGRGIRGIHGRVQDRARARRIGGKGTSNGNRLWIVVIAAVSRILKAIRRRSGCARIVVAVAASTVAVLGAPSLVTLVQPHDAKR